jgi:hypothetical protein
MGIHTTKYKTENGKTRKVKGDKPKDGAQTTVGADNKNSGPEKPAKQGA